MFLLPMLLLLLSVLVPTVEAVKPVFDGTFGANCPPCKEFGSTTLKKLYAADGIADAVNFTMHVAIRSAGSPDKDHAWACPDEDPGCPMTKWFICSVDGYNSATTTQDQRVNFLTCWDSNDDLASQARAKKCAKAVGLDMDKITKCATGSGAETLQHAAAKAFENRFPTHAHTGKFEVPHIFVDGEDMGMNRDYETLIKALCKTGIKAGACNSNTNAAPPKRPFPNVTTSFCDHSTDFQLDKTGALVGKNFSYTLCMDVDAAASLMKCTKGVPCPGGPDQALSVLNKGILYTVDHDGNCEAKACPSCSPPNGMPFEFILIDGANGDTSRGVATYQGTAQMDGQKMDHWAHDRGQVVKGMGVMNWYLVGNDLMRNSYIGASNAPVNPGGSGNRDFSRAHVSPAPASSFTVPKGCKPPSDKQATTMHPLQSVSVLHSFC